MNELAVLLQAQGKLKEAEPLMREALEGRREVLGPRHPHTLGSAKGLAVILQQSGQHGEVSRLRSEYGF